MALPNLLTKLFAAITQMEGAVNTANNAKKEAADASLAVSGAVERIGELENTAVHKAGAEDITGVKTWKGDSIGPRVTNVKGKRNIALEASAADNFGLYYKASDLANQNKWLVFCDDQGGGHLNGIATNAAKDVNNKNITSYAADIVISGKTISLKDGTGTLIKSITTQDTTYAVMQGATGNADGVAGLVPKPVIANREMYLGGDAKWHGTFTKNAAGLVPSSGGGTTKFLRADGTWVATPDTVYSHPTYTARTGQPTADVAPAFGGTFNVTQPVCDKWGHITGLTSRKITIPKTAATATAAGLVSTGEQHFAGDKYFGTSLYIDMSGTKPTSNTPTAVPFYIRHQDINGNKHNRTVMQLITPTGSSAAQAGIAFKAAGGVCMLTGGDGDTPSKIVTGERLSGSEERLYLSSDSFMRVFTNMDDGYSSAKAFTFSANGSLTVPGTVNTGSDERLKKDIIAIPGKVLDAWGDIRWAQFKMLADGDAAKMRTGLIAQRVDEVFREHGMNARDYGFLQYTKYADGEAIGPKIPGADGVYTISYTDALCLEAAYQRRRADRLEARLAKIEEKVFADN